MVRLPPVLRLITALTMMSGACLTGCTGYGDGPAVIGGTQTGVTIRYNPAETKAEDVDSYAISFCRAYDKKPIRRGTSVLMPEVTYQAYDCVDKAPMAETPISGSASPTTH